MNFDQALSADAELRAKMLTALRKKAKVDIGAISADSRCPLGKWLSGEGRAQFGKLASYRSCVAAHADFHRAAGTVAKTVNANKFNEAEGMLAPGTAFASTLKAVGTTLSALRKDAKAG